MITLIACFFIAVFTHPPIVSDLLVNCSAHGGLILLHIYYNNGNEPEIYPVLHNRFIMSVGFISKNRGVQ